MTDDTDPRRHGTQPTRTDPDERTERAEPVGQAGDSRDAAGQTDGTRSDGDDPADDVEKIRQYLLKGALGVLALLGIVATVQFYTSATAAINVLVSEEFQPIFQAAFNLVVLIGAGLGIAQVVRELG